MHLRNVEEGGYFERTKGPIVHLGLLRRLPTHERAHHVVIGCGVHLANLEASLAHDLRLLDPIVLVDLDDLGLLLHGLVEPGDTRTKLPDQLRLVGTP